MIRAWSRRGRIVAGALAALLAVVVAVPLVSAARFQDRIERALEETLQRQVSLNREKLHLTLWGGPGFQADGVTIHDTPEMGIEPLAYVGSLTARVRLASLLTGRWELSSVELIEPSVNLAQAVDGTWNVQPLLGRAAAAAREGNRPFPTIFVRLGRLNLKQGDRKAALYINNADLDLKPSNDGVVAVRFAGQPARTDRSEAGLGAFTADGIWRTTAQQDATIRLRLRLEQSGVGELMALVGGNALDMQGLVAAEAVVEGKLAELALRGNLELAHVRRWELLSGSPPGRLPFRGRWLLPSQELELVADVPGAASAPTVRVQVAVEQLLSRPQWRTTMHMQRLQVDGLMATGRRLGLVPASAPEVDGAATGVLSYSPPAGLQGELTVEDGSVTMPRAGALRFGRAAVTFNAGVVSLGATPAKWEGVGEAVLAGRYNVTSQAIGLEVHGRSLELNGLRAGLASVGSVPSVLERCRNGVWTGSLAYGGVVPEWSGRGEIRGTTVTVDGVAEPLQVRAASVAIDGEKVSLTRLQGGVGTLALEADYRRDPSWARPDRFRVVVARATAAQVQELLAPSLRQRLGLVDRALRRGTTPAWLRDRRAEGVVRIGTLPLGDQDWHDVRATVLWDGTALQLRSLEGHSQEAVLRANGRVSLGRAAPRFAFVGRVAGLPYLGGALDLNGKLTASGLGAEWLSTLRVEGSFQGRALAFGPEQPPVRVASGAFLLDTDGLVPRLRLDALQVVLGPDVFLGQGGADADARLRLELASNGRQLRLAGPAPMMAGDASASAARTGISP